PRSQRARRADQSRRRTDPDRRRPRPRERPARAARARRNHEIRYGHYPHRDVIQRAPQAEFGQVKMPPNIPQSAARNEPWRGLVQPWMAELSLHGLVSRREPAQPGSTASPARAHFALRSNICKAIFVLLVLTMPAVASAAAPGIPAFSVQTGAGGGQTYTLTLQVLALMTALTLLPAILLMMTAFTRIVIVLGILRQALGAGQTPPNQVLIGLALFLTFFVMSPVINRINDEAYKPYSAGTIDASVALDRAVVPLKKFMLDQT